MSPDAPQPESSGLPPRGWHPDPKWRGWLRWWDGTRWTGQVRPEWDAERTGHSSSSIGAGEIRDSTSFVEPLSVRVSTWAKNHKALSAIGLAGVMLLALIAGFSDGGQSSPDEPGGVNTSSASYQGGYSAGVGVLEDLGVADRGVATRMCHDIVATTVSDASVNAHEAFVGCMAGWTDASGTS